MYKILYGEVHLIECDIGKGLFNDWVMSTAFSVSFKSECRAKLLAKWVANRLALSELNMAKESSG